MRVIAGRWRGRRLRVPAGLTIRPTADRVKEAMFSILGTDLKGATFVDLCCGAGGLGIEALSRGAERAILIDTSAGAVKAAEANLRACGAPPDSWRLIRQDALGWLGRWSPPAKGEGWILVADPPYGGSLAAELGERIRILRRAAGFRLAIVEHGSAVPPDWPEADIEIRRYGGSCLSIFRPLSSNGS